MSTSITEPVVSRPKNETGAGRLPAQQLAGARVFLGAALLQAGQGGIARVARLTANTLLDAGCDLTLLSLLDAKPAAIGGRVASTARGSKFRFGAMCQFAALRNTHFIYDSAGVARAHSALLGRRQPFSLWMHGIEVWHALRPAAKGALLAAQLRIVNSKFTLDKYRSLHGDLPHSEICWLATEEDEAPAQAPPHAGPPTVMILARIDSSEGYKGHAELISCWPAVASAIPKARLIIAGGGPGLDDLRSWVRKSGCSGQIECLGFIEEADVGKLWQQTDVFAMPSRKEGFGIVYAEAMRYGVPVIASQQDAGAEINVHGETGFNVDLETKDDLAGKLIALLGSAELRMRFGAAGHARWRQHFRQSAFSQRLLPIMTNFVRLPR